MAEVKVAGKSAHALGSKGDFQKGEAQGYRDPELYFSNHTQLDTNK